MSEPHEIPPASAPRPEPPAVPIDAGSRALEEAFRSSFAIVRVVMALLLVVFVFSGVRQVGPQEKAVILHFGKPVGVGPEQLLGPGLHWAFPYPIDEVVPIPVGQVQYVDSTVGWYATTAVEEAAGTEPPPHPELNPAADGYVLTADGNILHVRARLRYRITDPLAYTFDFVNASNNVLSVLNNAIIYAAARSSVDDALLNNAGFKEKVLARVNDQIDTLKLGITLDPSDVTVIPPRYVKSDFDAVLAAGEDKGKTVLAAQGYSETVVRQAQARANSLVSGSQAEAARFVREVQADANSFTNQLPQYLVNPSLFRQRILAETWLRILARSGDKFLLPEREGGKSRELRLLLNREPPKMKTETTAPR
jgi:membrane protease subunit HflK